MSRFDGANFFNLSRKDGLPDDLILHIQEDATGDMWFYCRTGITHYNGCEIRSFLFPSAWELKDYQILRDPNNRVWISRNEPPYVAYFEQDSFRTVKGIHERSNLYTHQNRVFVSNAKQGTQVWASGHFQPVAQLPKVRRLVYNTPQLNDSVVWYTYPSGEYCYLLRSGQEHFFYKRSYSRVVDSVDMSQLQQDFYASSPDTLYHFDATTKQLHRLRLPVTTNPFSYIDQSGMIWLGSEEGLLQIFPKGIINYTQAEMRDVWSVVEDRQGTLWFPRYKKGLTYLKENTVGEDSTHYTALAPYHKNAFYFGTKADPAGNLYFPLEAGVLIKQQNRWKLLQANNSPGGKLAIYLALDSIRQQVVTGTRGGIHIFKNDQLVRYVGQGDGLHSNYCIVAIDLDPQGDYWLGSYLGLSRYDLDRHQIKNYSLPISTTGEQEAAITLHRDTKGVLWIGGKRQLMRYDAATDSILSIPLFEDLDYIMSIQETDTEQLLIAYARGLIWFDLAAYRFNGEVSYHYMNHRNGYLGIGPNQSGIYKDSKGDIWVPSSTITTRFSPSKMAFTNQSLYPLVQSINGRSLPFRYLKEDTAYVLNSSEVNFQLAAIGSDRPYNAQYRYLLEGYSQEWSAWSENTSVNIRELSSGNYRFLLQTKQVSSGVAAATFRLPIVVQLPLGKEPYFPLAMFGLVALLLVAAITFAWLFYRRGKTKTALNKQLRLSHEKVEAQYQEIKTLKEEQSHRFVNDLRLLSAWVDISKHNTSDPSAQQAFQETAAVLRQVKNINSLLAPYPKQSVELQNFLGDLGQQLCSYQLSGRRNIHYQLTTPLIINSRQARYLGLLCHELIVNSIKHAFAQQTAPRIEITIQQKGNNLHLRYQDNGSGIAPNSQVSLGSNLLQTMCDQLQGKLSSHYDQGQVYTIQFPLDQVHRQG